MTGTKVMKLWTAIVAAFVAVLAALGLAAPAAAATTAVPRSNESCAGTSEEGAAHHAPSSPGPASGASPYREARPPTMKRRIHAEAHGSSPSCRQSASGAGLLASALTIAADAARYAAQHDTARQGTAVRTPGETAMDSDGATVVRR